MHTKESLVAFEKRVAEAFIAKQVPSPIHLSGNNEEQLIGIFREIKPTDWKFSNWRSHYHALLSGMSEEYVFAEVLAGRSMFLSSDRHRFLSSAIVGGILPIAVGVAMGIRRRGGEERCWCFCGDMTAKTGIWYETVAYAAGHNLPMTLVTEDNGMSTNTPTDEAWGDTQQMYGNVRYYGYKRTQEHCGVGRWVQFS